MLFLVAKSLRCPPTQLRYCGFVYALLVDKRFQPSPPPIPRPTEMEAGEAIEHGVIPLSALSRTRWKDRSAYKDIEENGVIVERQGLTELKGRLFWKGKFVEPEIKLEFTWVYKLDPKSGKYLLTHAELEDGSTHELVDAHGQPTPFPAALFTIRHALGKDPTTPPEPLKRHARVVKYDGHVYRLCEARVIHDLTPEYLQELEETDWVRVYHATGIDSTDSTSGPQNMVFGIDALGEQRSHYHPDTPGGHSYKGLYVGPTKESVGQFGRLVFEFAVKVRNLHATDWSANISRKWEKGESGVWKGDDLEWLKKKCVDTYPFSAEPLLSGALDPAARADSCGSLIRALEPQALFVGIVPAKDILAVHYMDKTYTPQEFIEKYRDDLGWSDQWARDPKSTKFTWEDYTALVQETVGKDMESFANMLFMYLALYDENKVLQMLQQIAPFSRPSAEKLWRLLQSRYCDAMQETWKRVKDKRPDLDLGEPPPCLSEHVPRAASVARVLQYAGHVYHLADAPAFIAEVNAGKARWPGVELELRLSDYKDNVAYLGNFRVKEPGRRRGGLGSEVMKWITSLADAHNVTLKLHVEPFGEDAPSKAHVKKFYRGHGFTDRKQNWMARRPRTSEASISSLHTAMAFPEGDTYGATVYHGSHEPGLTYLKGGHPPYAGNVGAGVYVDFDEEVARFYGNYVYELKLLVHTNEIFYLDPNHISELYGHSIVVGETVYPFWFEIDGDRYAVVGGYEDDDQPLDYATFLASLKSMLVSPTSWAEWFNYLPYDKQVANALWLRYTNAATKDDWGEIMANEDDLPRSDDLTNSFDDVLWGHLESLGLDADKVGDDIDVAMEAFVDENLVRKSYGESIDLDSIGDEVKAHGYKALYVEGIRGAFPDSELLVFDPADLQMVGELEKDPAMNHPKRVRYNGAVYARVDNVREAWQNVPTEPDLGAARELSLYAQTSSEPLYRLLTETYYPPLLRRIEKGTYDRNLAVKHFLHFAQQAAKEYVREYGSPDTPWYETFNKSTRRMVAEELRDLFEDSDAYRELQA